MKNVIIFLVTVTLLSGCAALKKRSVADDIQRVAGTAQLVCATMDMFETDVLPPEVCQKTLAGINSDFYPAVYEVAGCIDSYNVKSVEFVQCIDNVDGWKTVAGLLTK